MEPEDANQQEEELPQQVADLAEASVPNSLRGIRACKRCGILKTLDQFMNEGTRANALKSTALFTSTASLFAAHFFYFLIHLFFSLRSCLSSIPFSNSISISLFLLRMRKLSIFGNDR